MTQGVDVVYGFLNTSEPLSEADLQRIEEDVFKDGDTLDKRVICRLLNEIRRLRHELNDPAYQYAGGRIHRHAVMCRDGQIDTYMNELSEARKQLAELRDPTSSPAT